jgi:hypothetical protein
MPWSPGENVAVPRSRRPPPPGSTVSNAHEGLCYSCPNQPGRGICQRDHCIAARRSIRRTPDAVSGSRSRHPAALVFDPSHCLLNAVLAGIRHPCPTAGYSLATGPARSDPDQTAPLPSTACGRQQGSGRVLRLANGPRGACLPVLIDAVLKRPTRFTPPVRVGLDYRSGSVVGLGVPG